MQQVCHILYNTIDCNIRLTLYTVLREASTFDGDVCLFHAGTTWRTSNYIEGVEQLLRSYIPVYQHLIMRIKPKAVV